MNQRYRVGILMMLLIFCSAAVVRETMAQTTQPHRRAWARNVIIPQAGAYSTDVKRAVKIVEVRAGAVIIEQVAVTTLEISLANHSSIRQEAELLVPVPDGAVVRGFAFQGPNAEPTAELLPRETAAGTYHGLVARIRDPALLEFAGYSLLRSSVFPIEAHGSQKVRLTYENLLTADSNRIDYLLPRSESVEYAVPWKISIRIKSKTPIQTVYSPTHEIETVSRSENVVSARIAEDAKMEPGPFRISCLLQRSDITASFLAYPDPKVGGGYFLLLAGLPGESSGQKVPAIKREVTLVIDRSGSMRGTKMNQVQKAASDILDRLAPGEAFNLIAYNESVESFASRPTVLSPETRTRAQEWIRLLSANGGTNIHDALAEALSAAPPDDLLPLVLFLTDGLPTVGRTSEAAIRDLAGAARPVRRRIFTFGVGADVNTPLLNWIADQSGGAAAFVLNDGDLEEKITQTFKRLSGPVMSSPQLKVLDREGRTAAGAVQDMLPKPRDLFEGDQFVILGIYRRNQPLTFELTGNMRGHKRTFHFTFETDKASVRNSYVPRLWASRKIGMLSDSIRQLQLPATDPRIKELVDEVVRLSTEFGVMTEYTSFLALEGTDLSGQDAVLSQANANFTKRALQIRSGKASVNQEINNNYRKNQKSLDHANQYTDQNLNRVSITSVRQISDRTYYRKNGRWLDSSLVGNASTARPSQEIRFASKEYFDLSERLAAKGRQGSLALNGDILIVVDGRLILVRGPEAQ
ncbi:MAG: VWA domain-containing protein [Acidobacteria bacterium]|nr:VWA domain-containing protein [Acidobacteriota bacterium]